MHEPGLVASYCLVEVLLSYLGQGHLVRLGSHATGIAGVECCLGVLWACLLVAVGLLGGRSRLAAQLGSVRCMHAQLDGWVDGMD